MADGQREPSWLYLRRDTPAGSLRRGGSAIRTGLPGTHLDEDVGGDWGLDGASLGMPDAVVVGSPGMYLGLMGEM